MKPPSNARQISSAESVSLLRFVFIQTLSSLDYERYKELVRKAKDAELENTEAEKPVIQKPIFRPTYKKALISDAGESKPEPPTIEEITERSKAHEPPARKKTQEERMLDILNNQKSKPKQ